MTASDFDREWEKLAREVVSGMKEWRIQHPRATWKELEEALDQRLNRMRARLLEDMALASEAARLQEEGARARCPQCGEPLASRGKRKRRLQTNGGEEIVLERRYGVCPTCQAGICPLDEELQLLPGGLTPNLAEELTHLGAWMPFEQAREMLRRMRGVAVSEATVRRQTERNGAAYVSVQEAEVERIEHEQPEAPIGPEKQVLSVDGAMAPLVGGAWAEVKTLVVGVLGEPVIDGAEQHVHARELSYFSRLLEAEAFTRLALTEIQRRGVEKAGKVIAVTDGAEWVQGFIDYHRPDAVRILDFPHAAEYVGKIGAAIWGEGTAESAGWLEQQLQRLKHEGPGAVLADVRALVAAHPDQPELAGWLAYLEKREAQMPYPTCQKEGWPMGSGAVESGNKLVVAARLKGSGMHWARDHVNPMLGLRNAVCSDRWDEAWEQICGYRRRQAHEGRRRRARRRAAVSDAPSDNGALPVGEALPRSDGAAPIPVPEAVLPVETEGVAQPKQPWRPPPDHPWRTYPACTSSRSRSRPPMDAKK